MDKLNLKELVTKYRKFTDIGSYDEICDHYRFNRCIITNKHIHYPNTKLSFGRDDEVRFNGTSPMTTKKVNGTIYNLKVGYDGMLNYFKDKYGEKNPSKVFNTLNEFTKFAFQISDYDYEMAKSTGFGSGVSLDVLIKRHGNIEGKIRWDEYKKKQAHSNTFEAKQERYGWSRSKFDSYNKSRSITLSNLIKKYGQLEGTLRYEKYCNKQSKTSTTEYLINTFGHRRTEEILNAKGKRIQYFEKKYGDRAIDEYIKYKKSLRSDLYYSKVSIEFIESTIAFNNLYDIDLYYADREYGIMYDDGHTYPYFRYDFTIPSLNLIIEFNGDAWHANPAKYKSSDCPHPIERDLTASQIWKRDQIKKQAAESRGFHVFYVWESEYKTNPDAVHIKVKQIIDQCRNLTTSTQ